MLTREDFEQQVVNYFTKIWHNEIVTITSECPCVNREGTFRGWTARTKHFDVAYANRPDGYESWEIVCRWYEELRFAASRGQTLAEAHAQLVERAEALRQRAELAALKAARAYNQLNVPL